MKKLVSLILAAVLLLCSCADETKPAPEEVLPESEINYSVNFCLLDFKGKIYDAARCGEKLFFSVYDESIDENGYYTDGRYYLYSSNLDGSGLELITPDFPEPKANYKEYLGYEEDRILTEEEEERLIRKIGFDCLAPLPDGRICLPVIYESYTDFSDIYSLKTYYEYYFYAIDENGNAEYMYSPEYDISEEGYFFGNITFDKDGNFITRLYEDLWVFNPDGTFKGKIPVKNYPETVLSSDGDTFLYSNFSERKILSLDAANMKAETKEGVPVPFGSAVISAGFGEYPFLCNTGTFLSAYDAKTESWKMLFTWINRDIDGNSVIFMDSFDENGSLVCVLYEESTGQKYVVNLKESDIPFAREKKVITLACAGLDPGVAEQIVSFNRRSEKYRIEVRDYSVYNTNEGFGGISRLTAELISGNVPDIFCTDSMPIETYASLGLLEDLWPYIENDEELGGRSALVEPFFKSLERGGKLYQISQSFLIYTVIAPTSLVGEKTGWTFEECNKIWDSMPDDAYMLAPHFAKFNSLNIAMYEMNSVFVDYAKAKCSFDSMEFIELLEFCNRFPAEAPLENVYEETLAAEGRLPVWSKCVACIDWFIWNEMVYGEPVTYIGMPGTEGNGSVFDTNNGFAMSSGCQNKEGAWEFMRMILEEDYQKRQNGEDFAFGLPTNKNVLDDLIEDAMTPDYWGSADKRFRFWKGNDGNILIERGAMTEEEKDKFLELINGITCRRYGDDKILEIVHDEAADYFAGNCTAKEAAKRIQNRAEIYLAEQS